MKVHLIRIFHDYIIFHGMHIVSVSSFNPSMNEIVLCRAPAFKKGIVSVLKLNKFYYIISLLMFEIH